MIALYEMSTVVFCSALAVGKSIYLYTASENDWPILSLLFFLLFHCIHSVVCVPSRDVSDARRYSASGLVLRSSSLIFSSSLLFFSSSSSSLLFSPSELASSRILTIILLNLPVQFKASLVGRLPCFFPFLNLSLSSSYIAFCYHHPCLFPQSPLE